MVAGRSYWIAIWYGILFLGMLGLWSSIYWGRQTHWKNLDELLRAIGTIVVSLGMLLVLNGVASGFGQVLLVLSVLFFLLAFLLGRGVPPTPAERDRRDDDEDPAPPPVA
jgi:fatty acid desaturase